MPFTPHGNERKWENTRPSGLNWKPQSKDKKVQLGPPASAAFAVLSSGVILSISDVVPISQCTANTHACLFFLSLKACLGHLSFLIEHI